MKPWPWDDSPIKRRERVALSYRAMLEKHAPEICAQLDTQMIEFGQTWVVPRILTYQDSDLLTADQVAEYCEVNLKTVYMWRAQRGMPSVKTRDGIRFVFAEVRKWKANH